MWHRDILAYLPRDLSLIHLKCLSDPKYVPVRVPHVHLADVPRHISRRESNVQPGCYAVFVNLVNVIDPQRHPHALVGRLERRSVLEVSVGVPGPFRVHSG